MNGLSFFSPFFVSFASLFGPQTNYVKLFPIKGVLHPWTLFLKTVHFLKK